MSRFGLHERHETRDCEARDKGSLSLKKVVPCPEVPHPMSMEIVVKF